MIAEHREYTFDEWRELTFEQQREIANNYWNPYKPELGRQTRDEIVKAFRDSLNSELELCEYRYFGFYADAIFAIPKEPSTELPSTFVGIAVNRGTKLELLASGEWKVQWKHSGTEKLKLNCG